MKTLLRLGLLVSVASLLLVGSSAFGAQIAVGIRIGAPPPPRVVAVPPAPGPGFVWVAGYWYPVRSRYLWHEGYWTRPPYPGAVWVPPHHDGVRFFDGYWNGPRGRVYHNHRWDHDLARRDFNRR